MGFLRTIDLSEVKNGEFCLDLKAFGKNRGVDGLKLKINKIKCKIELLEVACDSCHGRVSGINKICFLCSSYCRSQATSA